MRTVIKTHRIELRPNKAQLALFRQCVGASRFAYNWALAEWQRQYQAGEKPSEAALRRQFNAIKSEFNDFRGLSIFPRPYRSKPSKTSVRRLRISSAEFGKEPSQQATRNSRNRTGTIAPGWITDPGHFKSMASGSSLPKSVGCGCANRCASMVTLGVRL